MGNIKSFKMFLESYSEDLNQVLSNEENNYIVMKGDDIISGFEYLEDAFTNIGELLEGDGTLDEEQSYEFNDMTSELVVSDIDEIVPQDEIDQMLNDILDQFGIIEPYRIMNRIELEDTPIDASFDEDEEDVPMRSEDPVGMWGKDKDSEMEEELEDFLGESVVSEPFCIVGKHNGKTEEIDSFMSAEEADSYLDEYRKVYNEFSDMKVIHRDEMNENNLIFVPENEDEDCEECNDEENEMGNETTRVKTFESFLKENMDEGTVYRPYDIPPM